jgi:hypothetical protein
LAYRDALIKEKAFRVVDSDSRRTAVEELEISLSATAAGQKDQALGQLFAADYVAAGSVVQSDAGWFVAYTLSSSENGTIVASEFASARITRPAKPSPTGSRNPWGTWRERADCGHRGGPIRT